MHNNDISLCLRLANRNRKLPAAAKEQNHKLTMNLKLVVTPNRIYIVLASKQSNNNNNTNRTQPSRIAQQKKIAYNQFRKFDSIARYNN